MEFTDNEAWGSQELLTRIQNALRKEDQDAADAFHAEAWPVKKDRAAVKTAAENNGVTFI